MFSARRITYASIRCAINSMTYHQFTVTPTVNDLHRSPRIIPFEVRVATDMNLFVEKDVSFEDGFAAHESIILDDRVSTDDRFPLHDRMAPKRGALDQLRLAPKRRFNIKASFPFHTRVLIRTRIIEEPAGPLVRKVRFLLHVAAFFALRDAKANIPQGLNPIECPPLANDRVLFEEPVLLVLHPGRPPFLLASLRSMTEKAGLF